MTSVRFKLLPAPPGTLDAVADAQRALPLVPADEDDCCARLARRCDFPSRDVARTWITFLRALGLAEETPSGFKRLQREPTPEHLREAFLDRIMLAPETLQTLIAAADGGEIDGATTDGADEHDDTGALDATAIFATVREDVPTYEHHKNPNQWESIWRDRTADLLGWLALLELATRVSGEPGGPDAAYVPTARGREAVS